MRQPALVSTSATPCCDAICLGSMFRQHSPSSPADKRRRRRRVRGSVRGDSGSLRQSPCTNRLATGDRTRFPTPRLPRDTRNRLCLGTVSLVVVLVLEFGHGHDPLNRGQPPKARVPVPFLQGLFQWLSPMSTGLIPHHFSGRMEAFVGQHDHRARTLSWND